MARNMVIHLRLAEEMFIELMEIMEPSFLGENNGSIFGNLIASWVPICLAHILADMIRNDHISNTFHQLPREPIIIIIRNKIHDIFGLSDILIVDFLAIIFGINEAHVGGVEIGLHDRVVVVVFGV